MSLSVQAMTFTDCQAALRTVSERLVQKASATQVKIKKILRPTAEVALENTEDYQPEVYSKLTLSDRYIQTYKRIQNRNHKNYKKVFFYDYEVRDVILKMKDILLNEAKDFSSEKNENEKEHFAAYKKLLLNISEYESLRQLPYWEFHETVLLFTGFQKYGLKTTPQFQMKPQGRYSKAGYLFTAEMIKGRINTTGLFDLDNELDWQRKRSRALLKAPKFIFIPTFEELDEDFFNRISNYPVFPAGMSVDPHVVVDGQLFGTVLFMLHDFYHAEISMSSIDYSEVAIEAREKRRMEFNEAVGQVKNLELNKVIRVLYNFITHEERALVIGQKIVLSRSQSIVAALRIDAPRNGSDVNMFEEMQRRIYHRPYDFGEIFGDEPPSESTVFEARQWLADFFRRDTYYP